jgi:hypothetical protein
MEAVLGISLYSYPYSTTKNAVFLVIAYVYSSTKLEKRAEHVLSISKGVGGEREAAGGSRKKWPKQCMHICINQ